MRSDLSSFIRGIAVFLGCAAVFAGTIALYFFSLSHPLPIESWTEIGQEAALFFAAVAMMLAVRKAPSKAGGLWLVAFFLFCMFIRELDAFFDLIRHGSWKYAVIVSVLVAFALAYRSGVRTILPGLADFIRSRAFILMAAGLAMLLVYSRLYGWKGLWLTFQDGCGSWTDIKSFSEEAAEMVSYLLIFFSSVIYTIELPNEVRRGML
jgi:hypothetical protein